MWCVFYWCRVPQPLIQVFVTSMNTCSRQSSLRPSAFIGVVIIPPTRIPQSKCLHLLTLNIEVPFSIPQPSLWIKMQSAHLTVSQLSPVDISYISAQLFSLVLNLLSWSRFEAIDSSTSKHHFCRRPPFPCC